LIEISKHIIQACLHNDRVAQQQLFNDYNVSLLKSACIYLNDEELAKEVLQETWIDIFKGLSNYDSSKGQLITWMRAILIRKVWKANAKREPMVNVESIANSQFQEERVIAKMSCDEILKEMECIPEVSRMVFKMFVLEGCRHAEIAKFLNITESTSRVHLTRARKIMKKRYSVINQIVGE